MVSVKYPPAREILFLKGDINYTEFYLRDGRRLVSSTTLKRHEENFSGFLRVSKSHLLNPDYISAVELKGCAREVVLATGYRVLVSRRRKGVIGDFDCSQPK